MAKEIYKIPLSPTEFFDFQGNAISLCTTNASAWGISEGKMQVITANSTDFERKYGVANNKIPVASPIPHRAMPPGFC